MMERRGIGKKLAGMAAAVMLMVLMMGMTSLAAAKTEGLGFGQAITNMDEDASIVHYYKFQVKKPGAVSVSAVGVSNGYYVGLNIALCNAKGKVLEECYVNNMSSYEDSRQVTFGVNKGGYQIRIQTPYRYVLSSAFQSWPEKSGNTRTKAVTLKRKALKKGVVGIGESAKKADWYKIVLKKPAKFSLEFSAYCNRYLYVTVIPSKKAKIGGSGNMYVRNSTMTQNYRTTTGKKLPAGTYYVRVWRGAGGNSATNGIYTLRWK